MELKIQDRAHALILLLLLFVPGQHLQQEEREDYYRKWLNEDVVYIITPEEKSVFLELTTDEERDHFIEQFWLRRDSDPRTAINEFKEEHYRRIAYANESFSSAWDGWKTDRGRIYIVFGPPDERERHATGGRYQRPADEGGGVTTTYPFEVWFYRYLPGVGSGISIEFVDRTGTGDYRIALSPDEKDALLLTPGLGPTLLEAAGLSRVQRVRMMDTLRPVGLGADIAMEGLGSAVFDRLQEYFLLQRPPRLRYPDLKVMVDTRVTFRQLPFQMRLDVFRIREDAMLAPLTLALENRHLVFAGQQGSGKQRADVDVYGRVERPDRGVVYEFDDHFVSEVPTGQIPRQMNTVSLYQKGLPLQPGHYKLSLIVRDQYSGRVGTSEESVQVPRIADEQLALSDLMLAETIRETAADESMPQPFVVGNVKVRPVIGNQFHRARHKYMGLYFEVYNAALDSRTERPDFVTTYSFRRDGELVDVSSRHLADLKRFLGHAVSVINVFPVGGLSPGSYTLQVTVHDRIRGQEIRRSVKFQIV